MLGLGFLGVPVGRKGKSVDHLVWIQISILNFASAFIKTYFIYCHFVITSLAKLHDTVIGSAGGAVWMTSGASCISGVLPCVLTQACAAFPFIAVGAERLVLRLKAMAGCVHLSFLDIFTVNQELWGKASWVKFIWFSLSCSNTGDKKFNLSNGTKSLL